MKVEVWSDFVCPFCYIGKRRLESALNRFEHKDQVEVEFKSYELDPNSPKKIGRSIHEVIAEKYGMSMEEARNTNSGIAQQAKEEGLTYHFDAMQPSNTFDAHRLAQFAKTKGKEADVTEKLLHAYFTESRLLSDLETLADIASEAGISREEALKVLNNEEAYANEVRMDEQVARQIGVRGVPFFVINQKYAISGAQPSEAFLGALQKVWAEESAAPVLQDLSEGSGSGPACADGSCDIPERK